MRDNGDSPTYTYVLNAIVDYSQVMSAFATFIFIRLQHTRSGIRMPTVGGYAVSFLFVRVSVPFHRTGCLPVPFFLTIT
jgi:hypothetical protein